MSCRAVVAVPQLLENFGAWIKLQRRDAVPLFLYAALHELLRREVPAEEILAMVRRELFVRTGRTLP